MVSRWPPAAHSATQESHPTTNIDAYRSIIFLISEISLSSATITDILLGWPNRPASVRHPEPAGGVGSREPISPL
jgi:hypothetical protein